MKYKKQWGDFVNQILVTGDYRSQNIKKEKKVLEVNTIVIFFAISIIILGICIITGSIYAKEKINTTVEASIKPSVETNRNDENNTVEIKVTHIRGIKTIVYKWNEEEENVINANNQKEIMQAIDLIGGKNTLTITVTEENGQTVTYQKQFIVGNIPEIKLEAVSNGVKVIATSEDEIDYIAYKWDNEEEQTIKVGTLKYEGVINAPEGKHTLKVEVVDINKNVATKEQVVVGDMAPTATVKPAKSNGKLVFTIDAEDDENITKVEITLNNGETQVIEVNDTTYHEEIEMVAGENRIVVTVYNTNNLTTTLRKLFKNQ